MHQLKRDLRIHLPEPGEKINVRLVADDGKIADMRVFNISRSGLFVTGETPIKAGSDIEFHISDLENNEIRGRGRIVWQRSVDQAPDKPKGAGILLTSLDKGCKPLWQSLLSQYLNQISANQLMDNRFLLGSSDDGILETAARMQKDNTEIIVLNKSGSFGYLTAKDVLFAAGVGKGKDLRDLDIVEARLVHPDATPMSLLQMIRYTDQPYTIIGDQEKVLGFVRNSILFPYLAEFMELERERLEQSVLRSTARIVHDLQTPLSIISTSNQLLLSGQWEIDEYVRAEIPKSIQENCSFVGSLLNDLLLITSEKLDSDNLKLEQFNLVELCRNTITSLAPLLARKSQKINFNFSSAKIIVDLDRLKIVRVLHNLINNAMKYSPNNSAIDVGVGEKNNIITVQISDKGQGIKASELPYIFEEFNRGGLGQEKHSFGLGLAIVHRIVKASGGTIEATSRSGQGATFTIYLPKKN